MELRYQKLVYSDQKRIRIFSSPVTILGIRSPKIDRNSLSLLFFSIAIILFASKFFHFWIEIFFFADVYLGI